MNIEKWISKGETFQFKEHQVFYVTENRQAEETILLVHGFPTFSWDWSKMWELLPKKYNLVTADMLGFGNSSKPKNYNYTIAEQSDLFLALLNHLGHSKVHVLTHDYGVTVGQELLDRRLKSADNQLNDIDILSMAYTNGGMFLATYRPRRIQKLLVGPLGKFIAPFVNKGTLHRNFKAIFGKDSQPTQAEIDTLYFYMAKDGGIKVIPNVIQYMTERKNQLERWTAAMQKTTIPMRFINGAADPISGKHVAEKYLEIIPNPDVILLEGIGHYPNMEAPELVTKHYIDFLS